MAMPGPLILTAASMPVTGANGVIGDIASLPTSSAGISGVVAGANSNGTNGAAWTFSGGNVVPLDTIANSELLKGVATNSRLYAFLTKSFVDQVALDAAIAALGVIVSCNGADTFRFITAAPGVPTATVTTQADKGAIRVSIAQSVGA